jgi:hypothetical protein
VRWPRVRACRLDLGVGSGRLASFFHLSRVAAAARGTYAVMVRQLKHHEQKLLKKVDFLNVSHSI